MVLEILRRNMGIGDALTPEQFADWYDHGPGSEEHKREAAKDRHAYYAAEDKKKRDRRANKEASEISNESLNLMPASSFEPVVADANWLAHRLAEECPELVDTSWDEDRCQIVLDEARYDVVNGLIVKCGDKLFRLRVSAEECVGVINGDTIQRACPGDRVAVGHDVQPPQHTG
jgi:hypothetical protein